MKILIAEDDPISVRLLSGTLTKWRHEVVVTRNGTEALRALQEEDAPRVAILDWMMPGLDGVEVCRRLRQEVTQSPVYVILLTALTGKERLIEGLDAGADDYLTKPFDRNELRARLKTASRIVQLQTSLNLRVQQLEKAIAEKEVAEEALRNLSLTDHMTGLYNHRGFFTLAEHHAKIARRSGEPSLLLYADMDGLKKINDELGHAQGSQAICRTADILRQSFRECDLIARLGGDEFVVLAPNVLAVQIPTIVDRLNNNLRSYNERRLHPFTIMLSVGATIIDHMDGSTIEEHIEKADRAMYEEKYARKAARVTVPPPPTLREFELSR